MKKCSVLAMKEIDVKKMTKGNVSCLYKKSCEVSALQDFYHIVLALRAF